jgi:hypothetical protein
MRMSKFLLTVIFTLFIAMGAAAQQVDLNRGDLSILKTEKSINVEFTYDKMSVGDDGKEANYIKRRKDEMNAKEAGSGDAWAVKWEEDKKQKFEPKFILGFSNLSKMTVSKESKYTLIFNTRAMEPGYQVGISKRNAGIDGTITIVETANPAKKLIVISVERPAENKWRGAAFDAGSRIADAYYLTGQKVGKFIAKGGE